MSQREIQRPIRNLQLYVPDDRTPTVLHGAAEHIDVEPKGPLLWATHCAEAALPGALQFDIMSADINFEKDVTDPGGSPSVNSWGLAHALFALARRNPGDGYGNLLPMEWEVRTIASAHFRGDADATRLYGMVAALQVNSRGGGDLELALARSLLERDERNCTDEEVAKRAESGLALLLEDSLAAQPQRGSSPRDAVEALLGRWRTAFVRACFEQRVSIRTGELRELISNIQRGNTEAFPVDVDPQPVIWIARRFGKQRGDRAYGIRLASVFADVCKGATLDCARPHKWIRAETRGPASPVQWLEWLLVRVSKTRDRTDLKDKFAIVGRRVEEYIERRNLDELMAEYKGVGEAGDRGLLFIILVARNVLYRTKLETLKRLFLNEVYNIQHECHENTFIRGFEALDDVLPELGNPRKVKRSVENALAGRAHELNEVAWEGIRSGLEKWCTECLLPSRRLRIEAIRERAPGLFVSR